MKRCENCNNTYSDDFTFCPKCGDKLIEKQCTNSKTIAKRMFCPNCGCEVEVMGGSLCSYCGAYLGYSPLTGISAEDRKHLYEDSNNENNGLIKALAIIIYIIIMWFVVKA